MPYDAAMWRIVVLLLAAALTAVSSAAPGGQRGAPTRSADALWLDAIDAWQAGRYPDALRALTTLTAAGGPPDFHDRIASLTGELFSTVEITTDGRNPRVSRDAAFVMFETGSAANPVTRLVRTRPAVSVVADLPTNVAAFDPAGARVAWLRTATPGALDTREIVVRDLATGAEHVLGAPGLLKSTLAWSARGDGVLFVGAEPGDASHSDVFLVTDGSPPSRLTSEPGLKGGLIVDPGGAVLLYYVTAAGTGRTAGPGTGANATVLDLKTGVSRAIPGVVAGSLTLAADGSTIAWLAPAADGAPTLYVSPTGATAAPAAIRSARGSERITAPALSPDGQLVAYQFQARLGSSTDWDIHVSDRAGNHRRLTRDIEHDVQPRFLDRRTVLGLIGEPRHRRSHLYDLESGDRTRLFANNTIRTISPEYAWVPNAGGTHLVVQADRDGDTISPARGVYLIDLTRKVSPDELRQRLRAQLAHEADLRDRMTAAFAPIAEDVRNVVSKVSATRVYECQRTQASFDSKHITQPGNAKAINHLQKMFASFGYQPEVQSFMAGGGGNQLPVRTANVIARLRGRTHPDVIYIASSHFDSITAGPGADDNTSGTCALLEAARVLAVHPLPATVVFAAFTGEESGLFGSEEFVRIAREQKWQVAGALNNDMVGWAGDGARIDNTIRYSNRGIRDLQHGAAFLFSELVTFDAHYFYGTDAATFHEAWGDVFAGIGSYPILGNPNYHQPSDLLETISFRQVAETAKVTAASLMALASSPARLNNLTVDRRGAEVEVRWAPSPESDVTSYVIVHGPSENPDRTRLTARDARAVFAAPAGTHIAVKAVNARGLESWDWARIVAK